MVKSEDQSLHNLSLQASRTGPFSIKVRQYGAGGWRGGSRNGPRDYFLDSWDCTALRKISCI